MSPHRDVRGRGSFILDRRCGKVGRVKVASGTTDPRVHRQLNDMVTRLKVERRWDLLALLQRGLVAPLELFDALGRGTLAQLPTADDVRPFASAVARWLPELDVSPLTREQYQGDLERFGKARPTATLAEIPSMLRAARATALQQDKRTTFNHTRAALFSFLRDVLGSEHRITKEARQVNQLKTTPRPGNPLTPEQVRAFAVVLGKHASTLWSLALTGMRRGEYWGERKWAVGLDRVDVFGTKSKAARRTVPLVFPIYPPTIGYWRFLRILQQATNGAVNVHDLRKTFASWCESSAIPQWRIDFYMGHARPSDLARLYQMPRDMTPILREDAERLRGWLGDEPPQVKLTATGGA